MDKRLQSAEKQQVEAFDWNINLEKNGKDLVWDKMTNENEPRKVKAAPRWQQTNRKQTHPAFVFPRGVFAGCSASDGRRPRSLIRVTLDALWRTTVTLLMTSRPAAADTQRRLAAAVVCHHIRVVLLTKRINRRSKFVHLHVLPCRQTVYSFDTLSFRTGCRTLLKTYVTFNCLIDTT